ncbi:YesL family protein [Halobacillus sp. H74]|uniref:YesL family protein n=1 Tax=Halobacillus sp. H74 TaxID=3457436 RepID=UPI003FCD7271
MNQTSGIKGGLYAVSEWIMRFSLTNLQWALFNLPVALLLLSLLNISRTSDLWYLLPPLAILTPFIFFPATTAMFAKAREWVRKDHKETPDQSFFSYYKENYVGSLKGGFILTVLWGILIADISYFSTSSPLLMNIFFVLGILLFVFTINFFSVKVHFAMSVRDVLKQAFLITFVSPILFLTVSISCGFILMISLYIFPLIIPIFSGSIIAFLSFSAFYRLYLKMNDKEKNG